MNIIREIEKKNGDVFRYVWDDIYGVSCVTLTRDNYILKQSNWNTGCDAVSEIEEIKEMTDKEFRAFCNNSLLSVYVKC